MLNISFAAAARNFLSPRADHAQALAVPVTIIN
jgi:hypothetical protein